MATFPLHSLRQLIQNLLIFYLLIYLHGFYVRFSYVKWIISVL